jgi:D-sedoheptulose 7-phosphate isomerase
MKWEQYSSDIKNALDNFKFDEQIPSVIKDTVKNKGTIFVAGNGGSSALADHYVCDLSKGANRDWQTNKNRLRAINLSGNTAYLMAIANDNSYSDVFKEQLVNLALPGDVLMLISSSGNSPNIVAAAEYARDNGIIVIGITGFTGGKLKELSHYSAHVEMKSYEMAEDIHSVFGHFLAVSLREDND